MINVAGLNGRQLIAITIGILSVLMVSTTNLTDLFGANVAKTIVSAAGLFNLILGSVMAAITGQSSDIKNVRDMPGVEKITVNTQANQMLAQFAVDPTESKIAPEDHKVEEVTKIAEGKAQ